MDVTYDDIAKKASELGLYICEFFINDVGDGVCYWNRTGEKEEETVIEIRFKWDKQRKGAQTAGKLISMSVCYERLGIPSDCSLPYSGFFQIEPMKKEAV
jgi:hypothetical protein